jgi:hypothetical protein
MSLLDKIAWDEQWAEALTILFLAIGFIIAILLRSAFFTYLAVIICGALAARLYYLRRYSEPVFPFILMIVGFLVGYFLGTFWASRFWILVFFLISFGVSYYLHLKKILVMFKKEDFIK